MAGPRSELAGRFLRFAERECAGISPLYEALARAVAEDPELLDLAAQARPGQPPPNMLFAAAHYLLLGPAGDDPLSRFYPDLTAAPKPPTAAFGAFRAFCLGRRDALVALLGARVVATNEVRRAACLLPAFVEAARAGAALLHLIEVGAAAGFLLNWDRYAYDYGSGRVAGNPYADLTLACEVRGEGPGPAIEPVPAVASRRGIDPCPIDPRDPDAAAWLRALIWPEQHERAEHLQHALAIARSDPPPMVAGDALDRLPRVLHGLPEDGTPCVLHAFTLNQFPAEARAALDDLLRAAGRRRPVFRIGLEWGAAPAPELRLIRYGGAGARESLLARCDAHGAWIEWLAD